MISFIVLPRFFHYIQACMNRHVFSLLPSQSLPFCVEMVKWVCYNGKAQNLGV
jgi:hypothetical protein